ncbi:MAG: CDP-alcohol phosphatidyltransferase family protein [Bacteroidales bacterium]|nr:CDP-alcohol phosphatidyltransferase family protein [Bacteroidales bacterium]
MKRHIPNFLTICNLMCGVLSVIVSTTQFTSLEWAVVLIFCGAVFDFFDGFSARLLNVSSSIGKELDSLADLITFGFAPAAITSGIVQHLLFAGTLVENEPIPNAYYALLFIPYIIVAFSALRLAKFNVDERQTCSFIGLPTPANAIFFASFALMPDLDSIPIWFIEVLVVVFSTLLISEIPMFSLKFKNYSWNENKLRYSFLIVAVLLLAILQLQALTYIILCYILFSVAEAFLKAKK